MTYLAESLNEADKQQGDEAPSGRDGNQQTEHWVDQHSYS